MDCPEKCEPSVYELMKKCWLKDPAARLSFSQVVTELNRTKLSWSWYFFDVIGREKTPWYHHAGTDVITKSEMYACTNCTMHLISEWWQLFDYELIHYRKNEILKSNLYYSVIYYLYAFVFIRLFLYFSKHCQAWRVIMFKWEFPLTTNILNIRHCRYWPIFYFFFCFMIITKYNFEEKFWMVWIATKI